MCQGGGCVRVQITGRELTEYFIFCSPPCPTVAFRPGRLRPQYLCAMTCGPTVPARESPSPTPTQCSMQLVDGYCSFCRSHYVASAPSCRRCYAVSLTSLCHANSSSMPSPSLTPWAFPSARSLPTAWTRKTPLAPSSACYIHLIFPASLLCRMKMLTQCLIFSGDSFGDSSSFDGDGVGMNVSDEENYPYN